MKFSLVLATLNRVEELKNFLSSLSAQSYRNFELLVVDQNPDDRLLAVLQPYQEQFQILHLRSAPGLSRARNVGLKQITGDIVAFPDDDCTYPPNLLEHINIFFLNHETWSGLTGRSINEEGNDSCGRWDHEPGLITPLNVWRRSVSYSIFLKRSVIDTVGLFDESLGVGASTPWGSGEEIDYLLRALESCLYYDPSIILVHPVAARKPQPNPTVPSKSSSTSKTYSYALGRGRVLRKHKAPLWFVIYNWIRPFSGVVLSLMRGRLDRTRSYWATFQGRVQGWLGWA